MTQRSKNTRSNNSRNRNTRGRGASRAQPQKSNSSPLRWYGAGLLSGLFLAFMLYLVTLPADEDPATTTATAAAEPEPARAAPEYEFWEVLPQQEITVEVDPADVPRSTTQSDARQYLLQAGSFRQSDDADRRRAELLLLGLDPRVEETRGDTGRWYRVVIGPFENRSAMARARTLTAQQDIDTLLIQRKAG